MDTNELPISATSRGSKFDSQFLRRLITRVVIQDISSRLYLSEGDFWTLEIEAARSFDSRTAALAEATLLGLHNVQLVLSRDIKEWEIVPIGADLIA